MRTAAAVVCAIWVVGACSSGSPPRPSVVSGTGAVTVPPIQPGSVSEVEARLCAAGLVGRVTSAPPIQAAGVEDLGYFVDTSTPAPGTSVPAGSRVDLHLGYDVASPPSGAPPPALTPVPDVVGLDVNDALAALGGSYAVDVDLKLPAEGLVVSRQDPAPGTNLRTEGRVLLTAGSAPSPCPTAR